MTDAALCEAIEATNDPKKRPRIIAGCCIVNACVVETDPDTGFTFFTLHMIWSFRFAHLCAPFFYLEIIFWLNPYS